VQARRAACGGGAASPAGPLRFGNIQASFSPLLTVTRVSDGATLLAEVPGSRAQAPRGEADARGQPLFSSAIAFSFAAGTRVYGLGEHKTGRVDYAAAAEGFSWRFEDSQNKATLADNGDITLPVVHLSSGLTLVVNVASYGSVSVLGANAGGLALTLNSSAVLDLWVSVADAGEPTWPSLMGHLAQLIGPPAPLPAWATGFIQCKLRYRDQAELLAAAQGYVDRGAPLSAIVIDYMSWPTFGSWSYIERCWPDPAGMVRQLDAWGIALVQSVWPNIETASPHFRDMYSRGFLTVNASGRARGVQSLRLPNLHLRPLQPGRARLPGAGARRRLRPLRHFGLLARRRRAAGRPAGPRVLQPRPRR
jgi:alpha-D-xyloside xylohydrolase